MEFGVMQRAWVEYRLHKPVSDWLETLPYNIRTEYVREIPIGHN